MSKGKKQKLVSARKEIMDDIMKEIEPNNDIIREDSDSDDDMLDEIETYAQLNTFIKIHRDINRHVIRNNLSLCEYLSVDDIELFINKIFE